MNDHRIPQMPAMLLAIIGFGCSLLSIGGTITAMGAAPIPIISILA